MVATGTVPSEVAHLVSPGECFVLLVNGGRFDKLLRRDDLLDDGVAAVFGLVAGTVEILALCFHPRKFSSAQATVWLAERGFSPTTAQN